MARVRVEPPNAPSFEVDLASQEVVVGRVASAGLVVPDSRVSRQHARLFQRDGRWWAEDLGATNGTLLNDAPLNVPTALSAGDRLRMGGTIVHFSPPVPELEPPSTIERDAILPLDGELALAHDLQMAILPRHLPERPEVALAAVLTPARAGVGDLYDAVVDDNGLWFIVADVSTPSVSAVMYVAVVKTLFRAMAQAPATPADVLTRMNHELCRDSDQKLFITAVVGRLSLGTGELTLGDAGHSAGLMLGVDRSLSKPAVPKGIALGVMDGVAFEMGQLRLVPGATLVLYTDGAIEARDKSGGLFGSDRLERTVAGYASLSPSDLVTNVTAAVQAFALGAPLADDFTILALQYKGPARR
jgi:stage II sporulation SpoE-like protein/FHA domain-containing protein